MRMSCNGCRVLRKGCSDDCSIRPCLQWIKNPEWQANATVFLAKFYGRAGLMNLINTGPDHLRPAIFRSLLYEACGRMVNPIYGSIGLLWTGSWQLCQAAVEAVLKGRPIMQIPADSPAGAPIPPLQKAFSSNIRHVSKEDAAVAVKEINKVNKDSRTSFKRSVKRRLLSPKDFYSLTRPQSSTSWGSDRNSTDDDDCRENEAMLSVETVEESLVTCHETERGKVGREAAEDSDVELELTLGFEPVHHSHSSSSSSSHSRGHSAMWSGIHPGGKEPPKGCGLIRMNDVDRDGLGKDLGLDLAA